MDIDLRERLDAAFGDGPEHRSLETRLSAGRRTLRNRRLGLAAGAVAAVAVVTIGAVALQDGKFQHPVNIGDLSGMSCTACHKHTRAFQHPVNLGDLSQFKCTDCHAGKNWTLEGD